ncbi:MAG: HAD-IA family hydrolase [Acidobacteriota bacterium]
MAEITTLFWDIGGVLLTNAWDHIQRMRAVEHFGLEAEAFETRHRQVVAAFETHEITLQEYLWETVFYDPRPFEPAEFKRFMFAQSQACRKAMQLIGELSRTRRYTMASINNESLELNLYRIRQFNLRDYLSVFFSSCFLGVRKPDRLIYCRALEMLQRTPAECILIDDRPQNLEAPRAMGMRTIHHRGSTLLREELAANGIEVALAGA